MRPGVDYQNIESPPSLSIPTDTGQAFMVGLADRGPETPVLVESFARFKRRFGERVAYSLLHDSVELFFRLGGSQLWISRTVGPAAVTAFKDLSDSVPATTLKVSAIDKGDYGNGYKVAVEAGVIDTAARIIVITTTAGVEVERSPELATKTAIVDWSAGSDYVRITSLAGGGEEVGTFTENTRPLEEGAQRLIDLAVGDVAMRVGLNVPTELVPSARGVATIRAAMFVESSYFPEQSDDRLMAYQSLRLTFEEAIDKLIKALQVRSLFAETPPEEVEA